MLRWLTAGESHGPALSAIIEGIPAHVLITSKDIDADLSRRRLGFGRGARQNFEADKITITGGIRLGVTQGGPIAIQIANSEWPKWEKVMSSDPVPEDEIKDLARNAPLTRPRPGHADLVGMQKFNFSDARPVLERASARETASRVALGAGQAGKQARMMHRSPPHLSLSLAMRPSVPHRTAPFHTAAKASAGVAPSISMSTIASRYLRMSGGNSDLWAW